MDVESITANNEESQQSTFSNSTEFVDSLEVLDSCDIPALPDPLFDTLSHNSSSPHTISGSPTESTLSLPLFPLDSIRGSIWSSRISSRRSWIWNHGDRIQDKGKSYWKCGLCVRNPKRYADGSTKHPIDHLTTCHRMTENGPITVSASNTSDSPLMKSFNLSTEKLHFNFDMFQKLLINWIVHCHISFRQVEEPSFRLLLHYLSASSPLYSAIPRALPKSGNTVKMWILNSYTSQKSALIDSLANIQTVHFTFDLWTSPNHLSLLGLSGHWISNDGEICHALLGLKRLSGRHTGGNQCQIVFNILQEFKLLSKIGYFTLDNATNNDKALALLSKMLETHHISFNPTTSRLRCLGHVINLVAKVFLYGTDNEVEVTNSDDLEEESIKQLRQWRKRGPYGRLRNIITYICWTPQRRDEFSTIAHTSFPNDTAFQPIASILTRWNSDFLAIQRALHLRDAFELFVARHLRDGLVDDQLSIEDWNELQELVTILEPFYRLTSSLEGHRSNGSLYDLLPCMDTLLEHLENASRKYQFTNPIPQHLLTSIDLAWLKLNKYYTLADNTTVLYAAVALHPGMKFEYFDITWAEHSEWINNAKKKIRALWILRYTSFIIESYIYILILCFLFLDIRIYHPFQVLPPYYLPHLPLLV